MPVTEVDLEIPRTQIQISETVKSNDQLCTVCEQFAGQAAQYLGQNKTQTEIIETLHQACHELQPFEEQVTLWIIGNKLLLGISCPVRICYEYT